MKATLEVINQTSPGTGCLKSGSSSELNSCEAANARLDAESIGEQTCRTGAAAGLSFSEKLNLLEKLRERSLAIAQTSLRRRAEKAR